MAATGCSLNEAFPDNTERAGKTARKEEKKKAMRCKGPALSFLKGGEKDPDRPAEPLPPPPEKMETNAKANDPSEPIAPYFGKAETDEAFANFSPSIDQNPGYKLQPDFMASFQQAGLGKATGIPVNDSGNPWKPLWDQSETPSSVQVIDQSSLQKKVDTLFARLETMEHEHTEFASTEIALFILSGLFLLFGLETLRKFR
jgi:hypothetical protein